MLASLWAQLLSYGSREVGFLLSCMGIGGMFVQGVLVRVVVGRLGEEKTLFFAMAVSPRTRHAPIA